MMHEIEITEIPPLKPAEQTLLDMHSVLNVFNVLWSELTLIGLGLANDPAHLREGQALIGRLVAGLRDPVAGLEAARHIDAHIAHVTAEVAEKLAARPGAEQQPELARSLASLDAVFAVLRVRAREVLARAGRPELWLDTTVGDLLDDFHEVLDAIATGSHGRYGIVYNAALQGPTDYYVDLRFESVLGGRLRLPVVFKDAMCDLVANARKYTAPGGQITAALFADRERLRFAVRDNGRGIPAGELASVIDYGRRGSNVSDVRTMGGGFGLTKAFFVTKQFGGRFWIASELGHGTRVRIEIPVPQSAGSAG